MKPKKSRKEAERRERQRNKFLKVLDSLNSGIYYDCNERMFFRGLAGHQWGRPVDYSQRLKNRRNRKRK